MPFSPFSRSRRSAGGGPDGLAPRPPAGPRGVAAQDVVLVYEAALGRSPAPEEIAHQQTNATTLRELLAAVAASDEWRLRAVSHEPQEPAPEPAAVANIHTEELEPFGFAPGTWSADEVAITGHRGWVFLGGGTNAVLDQYRGASVLPTDFDARWAEALRVRRDGAARLGAAFAAVVVPDKPAVMPDAFPEPLPEIGRAPAAVLAARPELKLLYPVAELAAVPSGAFLRTDTHLTYAGNAALARAVGAALGVRIEHELRPERLTRRVSSGDLGSRFSPPIVEIVAVPDDYGDAEVIESNREQIAAAGAYVGTRDVLRNDRAPDPRTAVIFGDSYASVRSRYQGLAWFFAQAFREVHFLWVPFGWDPDYAAAAGAEVVVCQGAERFAIRPPELQVDVHALAAEVLGRRDGAAGT